MTDMVVVVVVVGAFNQSRVNPDKNYRVRQINMGLQPSAPPLSRERRQIQAGRILYDKDTTQSHQFLH